MLRSDVTTTSVRALSETHDHGKYSIAPPSQYRFPRASAHGVNKSGTQLEARIASRIRTPGVFSIENTARIPSVRFVAVMCSEEPGRFTARSANIHREEPGSHVSRKRPMKSLIPSPEFIPQQFMKSAMRSSSMSATTRMSK